MLRRMSLLIIGHKAVEASRRVYRWGVQAGANVHGPFHWPAPQPMVLPPADESALIAPECRQDRRGRHGGAILTRDLPADLRRRARVPRLIKQRTQAGGDLATAPAPPWQLPRDPEPHHARGVVGL